MTAAACCRAIDLSFRAPCAAHVKGSVRRPAWGRVFGDEPSRAERSRITFRTIREQKENSWHPMGGIVSRQCVNKSAFGSFCRFRPRGMANSSRRSFRTGAPSIQLIMPHRSGVDQKAQVSRTKDWARWCASSFAFVAGALIAGGFANACFVSSTASPAALRSANRSASRKRDAATRAVSGHVPASGPSLKVRASKSASNSQARAERGHRPLAVRSARTLDGRLYSRSKARDQSGLSCAGGEDCASVWLQRVCEVGPSARFRPAPAPRP